MCCTAHLLIWSWNLQPGELGSFTWVFIPNYTQGALQHPTSKWCNHSANWLDIFINSHSADEVSYSSVSTL